MPHSAKTGPVGGRSAALPAAPAARPTSWLTIAVFGVAIAVTVAFACTAPGVALGAVGVPAATRAVDSQALIVLAAGATTGFIYLVVTRIQQCETPRARPEQVERIKANCADSSSDLLERLPVGVVRITPSDRISVMNRAARRFLGVPEQSPPIQDLHSVPAGALRDAMLMLRQAVEAAPIDCASADRGATRLIRVTQIPSRDDCFDVMLTDVTWVKELEACRDEYLHHITHELRTPLTAIQAYAETLNQDFFDDEETRKKCFDVILTESRRLSSLVEDILSVARIEAGAAKLNRAPLDVGESLRAAALAFQAIADNKHIELILELDACEDSYVSGDREKLHRVWANLISNAIKYTPSGGLVTIRAFTRRGTTVVVEVSDTGIGIPPDHRERIFAKFYRIPDSRVEQQPGTGLGLSIAREIVRMHGGTIRVDSDASRGTKFSVELPACSTVGALAQKEPSYGDCARC